MPLLIAPAMRPASSYAASPPSRERLLRRAATCALTLAVAACADDPATGPAARGLQFRDSAAQIGPGLTATIALVNSGEMRLGPIALRTGHVEGAGGLAVTGVAVVLDPPAVATLAPGASLDLTVSLHRGEMLPPGQYRAVVTARAEDRDLASFDVVVEGRPESTIPIASLHLAGPASARRGDPVALDVRALDSAGTEVGPVSATFTTDPADGGRVTGDGRFVPYRAGPVTIVARIGASSDTLTIHVAPRTASLTLRSAGEGQVATRYTSDLWVHGDHAYTGSWGLRPGPSGDTPGNAVLAWRLDGDDAVVTDSILVDARTTNDVKVSPDGRLAVVTHEGSDDGRNGVTLLDLGDPAHPAAVGRFTTGLESGVHNAWIDGRYLYLVVDGVGSGLRILDISEPSRPVVVASYWAGESFLHDVLVRDGLAFLAHWDAGLVILDVGAGVAGGSPMAPVEVGRLPELGGQTHNVWYWPERHLAFVGEEDFSTPGRLHVVDVSELRAPREVATFAVPGTTPHNFWLDEEAGVLYAAWYDRGVRALDVSGELLGELDRQGRELGSWTRPGLPPACFQGLGTCSWAPQLHDGRLYLSDVNRGLVVLRTERK